MMRRMKRLIIYPLRTALGVPNNVHHDSVFIESRVLPIPYQQIYHSLLLARRYIKQATNNIEAATRHHNIFSPTSTFLLSTTTDPMRYIAKRCQSFPHRITSTHQSILAATSKDLWNIVFERFYEMWYNSQHPSNPGADPHSLFPCYITHPTSPDMNSPLYLSCLKPPLASIISRLRLNRSKLNQSLHKRARASSNECPTCLELQKQLNMF